MKINLLIPLFFLSTSFWLGGQALSYTDSKVNSEIHWDSKTIIDLIMSDRVSYAFLMASPEYTNRTMTKTDFEKGKIIFQGLELDQIISDLRDIPKGQITVPDALIGEKYEFYYSNPGTTPGELKSEFCERILDAVSLDMRDSKKDVETYELTLTDSSLLVPTTFSPGQAGTGFYDNGKYKFSNKDFDKVLEVINDKLDTKFISDSRLGGGYDFEMNISDLESAIQSLESYGFSISRGKRETTFYELYQSSGWKP